MTRRGVLRAALAGIAACLTFKAPGPGKPVVVGFTQDEIAYRWVGRQQLYRMGRVPHGPGAGFIEYESGPPDLTPAQVEQMKMEWARQFVGPSPYRSILRRSTGPGADTCTPDCSDGLHRHND